MMEHIFRFERNRIRKWLAIFCVAVCMLAVGGIWGIGRSYIQLNEQRTFDILQLIWEDREIIKEYWQDALFTVFAELPPQTLFVGIGCVILFGGIIVRTRKTRKIIRRRIADLANHRDTYRNT